MNIEQERATFKDWVQSHGCDTDGAWSAWMGRAALAPAGEPSNLTLAVIGREHFGNPIPQEWYSAARALLAAAPVAAPTQPATRDAQWKGPTGAEVTAAFNEMSGVGTFDRNGFEPTDHDSFREGAWWAWRHYDKWRLSHLAQPVQAQRAEQAEAKDAARLDWLEREREKSRATGFQWSTWTYDALQSDKTIRQQLDAAMQPKDQQP